MDEPSLAIGRRRVVSQDTLPGTLLVDEAGPVYFRSAAASDMGRVRGNNEDGFVDRPEAGLWAVADGMGGHSHGEVASQMVCDGLADFPLDGTFEEAIDAARLRLQQVNDHLVRTAEADPFHRSGSTVVMMLLRGARLGRAVGGGQPRVSLAGRHAGAADRGSQPGGTGRAERRGIEHHHPRRGD